jgi:hypothetical protein
MIFHRKETYEQRENANAKNNRTYSEENDGEKRNNGMKIQVYLNTSE